MSGGYTVSSALRLSAAVLDRLKNWLRSYIQCHIEVILAALLAAQVPPGEAVDRRRCPFPALCHNFRFHAPVSLLMIFMYSSDHCLESRLG